MGDRLHITAVTSAATGTVYLDLLRNKQTILTRALSIARGQANLPAHHHRGHGRHAGTPSYRNSSQRGYCPPIRELLIVTPADDLQVNVAADKQQYRPGEDAVLTFSVKDQQQHPVLAALGAGHRR